MPEKLRTLPRKCEVGFLKKLDRRTRLATRLRHSYEEILDDLGGSGNITHVKLALIERFVFLEAVTQRLEAKMAATPKLIDDLMGKWVQATNALTGLAKNLGIERRAKKVADLRTYLEKKA